jgi:uncharacterized membrane protein YgcG
MTYRALLFNTLVALFFGVHCFTVVAGQRQMPMQMQDMEKEMAEANKAIEEYIASLPPAEQAEFNRQVEEFSQMFENMDDEEFEKFLGEMFTEDQMPQPDFYQTPEAMMVEEVVEIPQLSVEQLKKVETAVAILNDIIKQSNMFTILVNSSPELPNRINKWGKAGTISDWQEGMTWDTLKIDLEYFIQKLYKVQEQDLTTKEYKFLLDLIADEALYNNIIQLRTSLNSLLPIINIPEFGIQKINAQSKEAIQNILKKYTESFYLLGIPKALDAIFEKYEPQAKKIRESESAANKRALEALKEPRTPAESSEAGMEQEEGYGGYDSYNNYSYDNYSPYGGGYDNYSPYSGGGSNYGGYSPEGGSSAGGGKSGGGGGGTSGGGAGKSSKEDKEEDDKKKKEEAEAEKIEPNGDITELIGKIKGTLETINKTINGEEYPQDTPKLTDLVAHISNDEETVNNDLASYILPTMVDKKVTELSDAIKKIDSLAKKEKLNSSTLKMYQKEIKKAFDSNTKELKNLKTIITQFEPQTETEKKAAELAKKTAGKEEAEAPRKVDVTALPAEKRWAYFAKEDAKTELEESGDLVKEELVEKISNPKSLFDIKKDIDNLFKEVKAFDEKKAPKPAAKKVEKPVALPAE